MLLTLPRLIAKETGLLLEAQDTVTFEQDTGLADWGLVDMYAHSPIGGQASLVRLIES